jgi:hypothetical protein
VSRVVTEEEAPRQSIAIFQDNQLNGRLINLTDFCAK